MDKQAADIVVVLRELIAECEPKEHIISLMWDEILHIGRSSKLPHPRLLFPTDPELSSRHAVVIPKFRSKRGRNDNSGSKPTTRLLDTRAVSVKDLGSLNGSFRNGERLPAKRVLKLALGETLQVGTVQLKLVSVTALNLALKAASPTSAAGAKAAKPGQLDHSKNEGQTTLASFSKTASPTSSSARAARATDTAGLATDEQQGPRGRAETASLPASHGEGPEKLSPASPPQLSPPQLPPPQPAGSPPVVDLLLSGGSSSASPMRSQLTASSGVVLPELPKSRYTRTQLHAVLSPPTPPSSQQRGSAAPSPSRESSSSGQLSQLHAAVTMQQASSQDIRDDGGDATSDQGGGGVKAGGVQSAAGQNKPGSAGDASQGTFVQDSPNQLDRSSVVAEVLSVNDSEPSCDSDHTELEQRLAAGGMAGGVHLAGAFEGGASAENDSHSSQDSAHQLLSQIVGGIGRDSGPVGGGTSSSLPPLPSSAGGAGQPPAAQRSGHTAAQHSSAASGHSPPPMRNVGDLWSDASIETAPSHSLQRRLLQLGVQPKRKRADNCSLLKKVQKLVLADPPWEGPAAGASGVQGGSDAALSRGALSAKDITGALVHSSILADQALHEMVLAQAPVPLERFVAAVCDAVTMKSPSAPSVAAAVREVLQADGVLFTSAWR